MSIVAYDHYPAVLRALELISQGTLPTRACDKAGCSIAVYEKLTTDDPELSQMRVDAERRGYDALAEALLDPAGNALVGATNDPKMLKVVSDNIKWFLGRRASKVYGEKIEVKQEITVSFAITDALEKARLRGIGAVAEHAQPVLEDVHFRQLPAQRPGTHVLQYAGETEDERIMRELLS